MSEGASGGETARFYTASRKYPRMIGRLPEGTRLWGGPYTFTQLGSGAAALALALAARPLWSTGSLVVDLLIGVGVAWGAAFAARALPTSRLNPAVVLSAALEVAFAPRGGTYRGRAVRIPRRRR
ncbi:MAG: hypothetical protein ACTH31_02170 [Pseudoclavibacter sp.]